MKKQKGISLFCGAGIGDVGFRAAGIEFVVMAELEANRAEIAKINFPTATTIVGDIWETGRQIIEATNNLTDGELFLITCTAPCQGMSKSGQGTLLRNIREGKRPSLDPRNRLIIPALRIIKELRPLFVVFENVCEMRNTLIEDEAGSMVKILDLIERELGRDYVGKAYDIEMADYGIAQRRKRLITVFTRDRVAAPRILDGINLVPTSTHSSRAAPGKAQWIPVKEVLSRFPSLDAGRKETASNPSVPFHRVPLLDPFKYEWVRHASPGASAFDNQCINPSCLYTGNPTHSNKIDAQGINRANGETPLFCEKCGHRLPRPFVTDEDGTPRIMSGYTSAYKRMDAQLPCPALTRNFSWACSDNKLHPYQHRVLSIAEALAVHSLSDYDFRWGPIFAGSPSERAVAPDTLIRLVVGESIPPRFLELLGQHILKLSEPASEFEKKAKQYALAY